METKLIDMATGTLDAVQGPRQGGRAMKTATAADGSCRPTRPWILGCSSKEGGDGSGGTNDYQFFGHGAREQGEDLCVGANLGRSLEHRWDFREGSVSGWRRYPDAGDRTLESTIASSTRGEKEGANCFSGKESLGIRLRRVLLPPLLLPLCSFITEACGSPPEKSSSLPSIAPVC